MIADLAVEDRTIAIPLLDLCQNLCEAGVELADGGIRQIGGEQRGGDVEPGFALPAAQG